MIKARISYQTAEELENIRQAFEPQIVRVRAGKAAGPYKKAYIDLEFEKVAPVQQREEAGEGEN